MQSENIVLATATPEQVHFRKPRVGVVDNWNVIDTVVRPLGVSELINTSGQDTIMFQLPQGKNRYINASSIRLCFSFKYSNLSTRVNGVMDPKCGAHGIIDKLTLHNGVDLMEEERYYGQICAFLGGIAGSKAPGVSQNALLTAQVNSAELKDVYGKVAHSPQSYSLFEGRDLGNMFNYIHTSGSNYWDFRLDLKGSGVLTYQDNYLPTNVLKSLQLTLVTAQTHQFTLMNNDGYPGPYSLKDIRLEMEVIEIPNEMNTSIAAALIDGKTIDFKIPSFTVWEHTWQIPASQASCKLTYNIPVSLSSLRAIFIFFTRPDYLVYKSSDYFWYEPGSTRISEEGSNLLDNDKFGFNEWQVEINQKRYPPLPCDNKAKALEMLTKAIARNPGGVLNLSPFDAQLQMSGSASGDAETLKSYPHMQHEQFNSVWGAYTGNCLTLNGTTSQTGGGDFVLGLDLTSYQTSGRIMNGMNITNGLNVHLDFGDYTAQNINYHILTMLYHDVVVSFGVNGTKIYR